jgi:Sigma-70 region 2
METSDRDPGVVVETDPVVAAAQAGDEAAFAVLVDRHQAEPRVHCCRLLGSLADAEDLVQEAFLRAWSTSAGSRGGRQCGPGCIASRPTRARLLTVRTGANGQPAVATYARRLLAHRPIRVPSGT